MDSVNLLEFLVLMWLHTAIHEFGHLVVAYQLDRPIRSLSVATGPLLFKTYWQGIRCEFRLIPITGCLKVVAKSRYKWKNIAVAAGGPAASLLTAAISYYFGLNAGGTISLIFGIGNLLPFPLSDGEQILAEIKRVSRKTDEV